MGYIGVKEIIGDTPLGQPVFGHEILFRDKEDSDKVEFSPSYKPLKRFIETAFPDAQVNLSRCHEGKISFVTMGVTSDYERERLVIAVRDKIVDVLESGYSYASIEDLCNEFCREDNPQIRVRYNNRGGCFAIEYWSTDISLRKEILGMKLDQINIVAKGAFFCIEEPTTAPRQITLLRTEKRYNPGEYHIADAVREIVDMLEAACPQNKHYDPDYFRKILV